MSGAEEGRLPARLEVTALLRRVQQEGGFATILAKGEEQAGTILLVAINHGCPARAFERMPQAHGGRDWTLSRTEDPADPGAFQAWLERRRMQDPDLWIAELDIPNAERFILPTGKQG